MVNRKGGTRNQQGTTLVSQNILIHIWTNQLFKPHYMLIPQKSPTRGRIVGNFHSMIHFTLFIYFLIFFILLVITGYIYMCFKQQCYYILAWCSCIHASDHQKTCEWGSSCLGLQWRPRWKNSGDIYKTLFEKTWLENNSRMVSMVY